MKKSFFKTIIFSTSSLFIFLGACFLFVVYTAMHNNYIKESENLKEEHIKNVKDTLMWEVEHYIELIKTSKERCEEIQRKSLKNRIQEQHFLMQNLYEKYKDTKSSQEIQKILITALRKVRFPNHGYYFIIGLDGVEILHDERKVFEGQNVLGLHNSNEVYIIKEMIDLVKSQKEGFYSYMWSKPNNGIKEVEKLSYIKLFEPFGWIIGTGFYKDDLIKDVQDEILNNIEQMKLNKQNNNYIFIGQWDGVSLTYPTKGKNMFNIQDKNGLYIVQELIKKAKEGGGFVEYMMPSLGNERNSQKISYSQGLHDWQWYVGAGLYVDDINQEIVFKKEKMHGDFRSVVFYTFLLMSLVFVLFYTVYRGVNKKIKNDFSVFIDFFSNLVNNDKKIDTNSLKFYEFEEMALFANAMLDEKRELQDHLNKYKTIVSTSGDFLSLINKNYIYQAVNQTYVNFFGKKSEEIIGHSGKELFGEDAFEKTIKPLNDRALKGESFVTEQWIDFPEAKRYLQVQYFPYLEEGKNEIEFFVVSARDITENKFAQDRLKLWEKVFESTSEAVMLCDVQTNIVAVNHAFCMITGYSKEEVIGQKSLIVNHDLLKMDANGTICKRVTKYGSWSGEVKNRRKNGEVYPSLLSANAIKDEEGNVVNYVAVFSDISSIKESESKLEFLAHHDILTHLPNRVLLNDRISHGLENAKRENSMVAICFIDLDNFKKINDSFGHTYGDDVLQQSARRIKAALRATDTLSRIGGDEFVLVLEHLKDVLEVEEIIKKVQRQFIEPFMSKHQKFFISASIGISLYPQHGMGAEELIKNADTSMYKAKDAGRNTYRFYTQDMSAASHAVVDIENALKEAIEDEQFLVFYQPQINLKTKELVGIEALVRWEHPQKGILSPIEFIKFSEDTKMIIPIGEFVLKKACEDLMDLKKEKLFYGKVSINVSGIQIEHSDFLGTLNQIIKRTGIEPHNIELEITESVIMFDPQRWIELLKSIKNIGVTIAIDDFGTGYSSLSYLRKLPIDKLKIDMSFVRDLPDAEDACSIANSIINLSDNMKMITLAEGIETIEQEKYLRENNCEEGQGYLYGKPMDLVSLKAWIKAR